MSMSMVFELRQTAAQKECWSWMAVQTLLLNAAKRIEELDAAMPTSSRAFRDMQVERDALRRELCASGHPSPVADQGVATSSPQRGEGA